jgi:hypothetical protein
LAEQKGGYEMRKQRGDLERIESISNKLINYNVLKLLKLELEKVSIESITEEICILEKKLTLLKNTN